MGRWLADAGDSDGTIGQDDGQLALRAGQAEPCSPFPSQHRHTRQANKQCRKLNLIQRMGGLTCGCSGRRLAFREKCKCPGNITAKRRQQTKRIVGRYAERPRDGSPLPLLGEQSPKNSLASRVAERLRLLRSEEPTSELQSRMR